MNLRNLIWSLALPKTFREPEDGPEKVPSEVFLEFFPCLGKNSM